MNPSQQTPPSAAEDLAALWAARLDGDPLDATQRAELDAWLAEQPTHRTLLSQYCQLSADLEEQAPALVARGRIAMPVTKLVTPPRNTLWPRWTAAVLATAAGIAVFVSLLQPAPQVQNLATSPSQRSTHALADGTRVELNAQTSLRFENTKDERRARLAGGEALFAVAKDQGRPFIVETPTGSVRVTGTTFNVRTDPSSTAFEVTVLEGSVQVRPSELGGARSSAPIALAARDQLSARGSAVSTQSLSDAALEDALAWRDGQIVFRDTTLEDALARFSRHHGRSITAAPAIARERLGGRYSIDDLSGFLAGLELMLPVKAQYGLNGEVTVTPRAQR